jgi:hypothetical protein
MLLLAVSDEIAKFCSRDLRFPKTPRAHVESANRREALP